MKTFVTIELTPKSERKVRPIAVKPIVTIEHPQISERKVKISGSKLPVLPKKFDVLDVKDSSCQFRINIDVLNEAFGVGRSMYAKASYPDKKGGFIPGTKAGDKFFIWMPKLYGNSSEWKNIISKDGSEIYEVAEGDRHEDWINEDTQHLIDNMRIIFAQARYKGMYKFVGVFRSSKIEHCNHTYERIATRVKLIGNPVTRIELLDDCR